MMTRAKTAALGEESMPAKTLQTKKSTANVTSQAGQRKRAALGDVSNVAKIEVAEGKKPLAAKGGLVSKAAQPTGIQKKATASRTALATKEVKKTDAKRSGSGAIGVQKRKVSTTTAVIKEGSTSEEGEPVRKKAHTLEAEKKIKSDARLDENAVAQAPEAAEEEPVVEVPEGVKNLDDEDLDDPLMVAEYANEIFEYLHDLECNSMPNPQYMSHQDDLEWKTRGILVDWLIEVHTRFHLLPETLFLAVNIIDRFLSEKVVLLDRLQLVGVTAMFIASKYEEVTLAPCREFSPRGRRRLQRV